MVCGRYRTGKSFLLNQLAGTKGAFGVGHTVESHTRGIWLCAPGVVGTTAEGEEVDVVFMDSEGLGSTERVRTPPKSAPPPSPLPAPALTISPARRPPPPPRAGPPARRHPLLPRGAPVLHAHLQQRGRH